MKTLLAMLLAVLAVAMAVHGQRLFAQEPETIQFHCGQGICVMTEQDFSKLHQYVDLLAATVRRLRSTSGCS